MNGLTYPPQYRPKLLTGLAVGAGVALTATMAKITWATTPPDVTLNAAGVWLIRAFLDVYYHGATFDSQRQVSMQFYEAVNRSAAIGYTQVVMTDITNVKTETLSAVTMTTLLDTPYANDRIELWGKVNVLPVAGDIQIRVANIEAVRVI